jgi:PiT family inorganic phosphate transporter
MGVVFLALISYGGAKSSDGAPPVWVILSCALAIALGTYLGGWRVIRTLGKGLVEIDSPQGMAAETSSAATILLSSQLGYPLSTTHVVTGSVLGSGVGKPGADVRWGVAGRMATAWLLTLPAAGVVGAALYTVVHGIGGFAGATIGFLLLVAVATAIWLRPRKSRVDHNNVNDDWDGKDCSGKPSSRDTRSEKAAVS